MISDQSCMSASCLVLWHSCTTQEIDRGTLIPIRKTDRDFQKIAANSELEQRSINVKINIGENIVNRLNLL